MEAYKDFKELLELFNAKGVEYLVVGGYALAFHGAPRYTGDLDLYVRPTPENGERIVTALADFGFASLGLKREDFVQPDQVIQLGVPPVRVDMITSIDGVTWDEAWTGSVQGEYGGVPVRYIGRAEFIHNKRAAGRQKDRADLESLDED
jgi:hypothetical protein